MKIYLVGGAVRDKLLNYPTQEQDWVVVGSTPAEMLQLGFKQVGRDFPVFLHPKTGEEHALARTERKNAPGYYGFDCDYAATVSLEEDLARRDLTINAIAMDEQGNFIDPYNGMADLKARKLRHVSQAFTEDPVRVLRVARFAARYHHLGFTLCDETRFLMYTMVLNGELAHLVPERVWQELARALSEKNPEVFILVLRACAALAVIFPEIDALFGVPATPKYHPEVDTGVHVLMVLQYACKLTTEPMTRFGALVHDLGKALTPEHEWPRHLAHEHRGLPVIESLCARLRVPTDWRKLALIVCKQHLNIHRIAELRAKTIVKILEETDAFRQVHKFDKLLQVCEADAGHAYGQLHKWHQARAVCEEITAQALVAEGLQGLAIKNELHARRVARVQELLTFWKQDAHEKQL